MKEKDVSRIILIDNEGDLAGIVSRSDLMQAFIKPTPKMRFPKEGTYIGFYSLAGEKKFRQDAPALQYATALVSSIPQNTPMETVVSRLITSLHNSIVMVNKYNKPTGFLSTRDLLQAVSLFRPEEDIPLIIKNPSSSVSANEFELVKKHLTKFGKKLKKRMTIEKIEIAAEESKNPREQTIEFTTTLIVTPTARKSLVAVTKHRGFLDGIQEATAIIERQRRKKGLSKKETRRYT
jgi:CBS domain-containing protein